MPKVSRETATQGGVFGPVEDRSEQVEGYTVSFVSFQEDVDATPLMRGLPDDRCQCPHWGFVITGRMTMRFGHRDEVYEAGDAWYAPPGHVPISHAPGTEILLFSPTDELSKTEEAMERNMRAMAPG